MFRAGLRCPEPIKLRKHVMIMSLIGAGEVAAPKLKYVEWFTDEGKTKAFEQVKEVCEYLPSEEADHDPNVQRVQPCTWRPE